MLLETFLGSFPLFVGCGFSANLAHRGGEGQPDSDSELTQRFNIFFGMSSRNSCWKSERCIRDLFNND